MNSEDITNPFIIKVEHFDLQQTLECGQCFRFNQIDDHTYLVLAKNNIVKVKQEQNKLFFFCNEEHYLNHWKVYFDIDRDYGTIKDYLSKKDQYLKEAISNKHGVRLLQQDPWEMLISFILSQTKQIPHIKKLIQVLSEQYGAYIGRYNEVDYYAFPTPEQLKEVTEESLRRLKIGFRAAYIVDVVRKIEAGIVDLEAIKQMTTEEGKEMLKSIRGVGNKVADCVLLFAYNRYEVFPTDVWVKRIVELYYPQKSKSMDEIQAFAKDYFGELAGFAQQYLFYHARDNKLGK